MTASTPRVFYGRYLAALSFFLGFTSGGLYLYSRGIFVRDQIVDFDVSRTQISLAFTAVQIVGISFAPVLGYLLDRYPIRNVMMTGALWLGLGFFALSQVEGVTQFAAVAALVLGLGTGTIGTTANSKLMVTWFDRRRGLALGIAIMGYSTAGVVISPFALYLLDTVGWRVAYMLFGCVCLLVVLPAVALLVKPRQHAEAVQQAPHRELGERTRVFLEFSKSPNFWGIVLVFGLMEGAFGGLNLHLFLHYTQIGIEEYKGATILSFTAGLAIVSKPMFGWLIDRFSARSATLISIAFYFAAMLGFARFSSFSLLLSAGALFGLAYGAMVPLRAALLSRLFPTTAFGRAYGSTRLCMFPMTVVWTPLIGLIYDASNSYVPVFELFLVVFAAAALAAYYMIPRRIEKRASERKTPTSFRTAGRIFSSRVEAKPMERPNFPTTPA